MQYSILTEPWISVVDLENQSQNVSLLTLLEHADKYREISYQMAMVESSVLLFVINFVTDAYVTHYQGQVDDEDEDDISLIRFPKIGESIDMHIIKEYVDRCCHDGVSFDLFDIKHPFYQIWDDVSNATVVSVGELDPRVPTGHNSRFIARQTDVRYTPAEAFVLLLSRARYAPQMAGQTAAGNLNGSDLMFFFRRGNTVYETVVKNILRHGRGGNTFDTEQYGIPWYRCMDKVNPKTFVYDNELGWLNGTFFMRHVYRLIFDENGISQVYFQYGIATKSLEYPTWHDPYQMCVLNKDGVLYALNAKKASNLCYNEHFILDAFLKNVPLGTSVFGLVADDALLMNNYQDFGFVVYEQLQNKGASVLSDIRDDIVIPGIMFRDTDVSRAYKSFVMKCVDQITVIRKLLYKHVSFAVQNLHLAEQKVDNRTYVDEIVDSAYSQGSKSLFEAIVLRDASVYDVENAFDDTFELAVQWRKSLYDFAMVAWKSCMARFVSQTKYRIPFLIEQNKFDYSVKKELGL